MSKVNFLSRLMLAATMMFFVACSKEEPANMQKSSETVDVQIKTGIPQTIQTYASADGGATNVDANKYALRYIMEAWTDEATPRLAYRGYKIVENNFTTKDVTFDFQLFAMKYNFVFWADFIDVSKKGTPHDADLFYATNNGSTDAQITADPTVDPGLQKIVTIKDNSNPYDLSNDARDAYYAVEPADLTASNYKNSITLKRPFGKYRLVSIDTPSGFLPNTLAKSTKIQYTAASGSAAGTVTLPAGFNALTKTVLSDRIDVKGEDYITATGNTESVAIGANTYPNALIIGFDYIFANQQVSPVQTVAFDLDIFFDAAATEKIGVTRSITQIPIKANTLTTIYGNFFTNNSAITVIVDDAFGNTETVVVPGMVTVIPAMGGAYKKDIKLSDNAVSGQYSITSTDPAWAASSITGSAFNLLHLDIQANTSGAERKYDIKIHDNQNSIDLYLQLVQYDYIQLSLNGTKWAVSNIDAAGTFAEYPGYRGQFYQFDNKNGRPWVSPGIPAALPNQATIPFADWDMINNNPCPAGWKVAHKDNYDELVNLPNKWYKSGFNPPPPNWLKPTDQYLSYSSGVWVGPDAATATTDNWGQSIFFPAGGIMGLNGGVVGDPTYYTAPDVRAAYWTSKHTTSNQIIPNTIVGYVARFQMHDVGFGVSSTESLTTGEYLAVKDGGAFTIRAVKQ